MVEKNHDSIHLLINPSSHSTIYSSIQPATHQSIRPSVISMNLKSRARTCAVEICGCSPLRAKATMMAVAFSLYLYMYERRMYDNHYYVWCCKGWWMIWVINQINQYDSYHHRYCASFIYIYITSYRKSRRREGLYIRKYWHSLRAISHRCSICCPWGW